MKRRLRIAVLAILVTGIPNASFAIAYELSGGPGVQTNVVRVYGGSDSGSLGMGTGTIIDVVRDPSGPGGYLCVLTADHVVASSVVGGSLYAFHRVAFGDEGGGGPSFDTTTGMAARRGMVNSDGTLVDLGLLGVRVSDLSLLPTFTPAELGTADYTGTMFMEGYGLNATFDGVNRRYLVTEGSAGDGHHGFNGVLDQPVFASGIYKFNSIHATTVFGPPLPEPAIQAEAHLLNGDSG